MDLVVKVFLEPGGKLPQRGKDGDAGLDVFACLPDGPVIVKQGDQVKIPLGFRYAFWLEPNEYDAREFNLIGTACLNRPSVCIDWMWFDVRNRSGVGTKSGMATLAEVGDANYRGVLHYCAAKITPGDFTINHGDKIAQILLVPYQDPRSYRIEQVATIEELGETNRGATGFGDSGAK